MAKHNDEVDSVVFQALSHPMRRTIIRRLEADSVGVSYTELVTELGLSTGKMNYHLEQLEGLVEKNSDHRYMLTTLGKKALNQLNQLNFEVTEQDMKCLKIASKSQRGSLEPTIKAFLWIGIVISIIVTAVLSILAYAAATEGGAPVFVYVLLPVLMAIEVSVTVTLVRALRNAPEWLRRLEKRFIEPA